MKVLIVGSEGSMGKRYQAILNGLRIEYDCCDYSIERPLEYFFYDLKKYSHLIVATPTSNHYLTLDKLRVRNYKGRILCEKPVVTSLTEMRMILTWDIDITVMLQYGHLLCMTMVEEKTDNATLKSSYDYFRTGNDGLIWDCFQIISLHEGPIENLSIGNSSAIWKCTINNNELNIKHMDFAYVTFVSEWLFGHSQSKDFIYRSHEKVAEFKDWYEKNNNRHTGA